MPDHTRLRGGGLSLAHKMAELLDEHSPDEILTAIPTAVGGYLAYIANHNEGAAQSITLETANMLCSAAMAFVETMPEKKGDEFSHMLTRLMRDKDAAGKAIQMAGRFEKEFSPHKEGAVEALAAVSMLASSLIVAITKVYGKENTSPMIFQFLEVLYDNLDDMSKEAGVDCPKGITDRVMIRAEGPAPDQTMQ